MHSKFIYHVFIMHLYVFNRYFRIIKKRNHPSTHFSIIIFSYELLKHYHIHVFLPLARCSSSSYAVPRPINLTNGRVGSQLLSTKI